MHTNPKLFIISYISVYDLTSSLPLHYNNQFIANMSRGVQRYRVTCLCMCVTYLFIKLNICCAYIKYINFLYGSIITITFCKRADAACRGAYHFHYIVLYASGLLGYYIRIIFVSMAQANEDSLLINCIQYLKIILATKPSRK